MSSDPHSSVTIRDVARVAGVSVSSVSLVLNGKDLLSPETADRIRQVMADLGYSPRPHRSRSRNLRSRGTPAAAPSHRQGGQVLFLVSDDHPASLHTPQMARISVRAAELLAEAGKEMLLANMPSDGRVPQVVRERQVEGVLLRGGDLSRMSTDQIEALGSLPCVEFFGHDLHDLWDMVWQDVGACARLAYAYLKDGGCRQFWVVNAWKANRVYQMIADSFRHLARLDGLPVQAFSGLPDAPPDGGLPGMSAGGGRLGVFVAGHQYEHLLDECERRAERGDAFGAEPPLLVSSSNHARERQATIGMDLSCLAQHGVEQLLWRVAHPAAAVRSIYAQPRLFHPGETLPSRSSAEPPHSRVRSSSMISQ